MIYGEKFQILNKKKGWLKIKTSYDKYTGFIKRRKFIKNIKITHKISSLFARIYSKPKNKYILVVHNNPQSLRGAVTPKDRKKLIKICSKIIFVSNWVKEKFFEGLDIKNHENCQIVYPAINKINKLPKKENSKVDFHIP